MFKDTKDFIALAAIIGMGLLLYTINTLTLNVIVLGLVSVLLIVVVLIQNPKGGGLDSTFGGNAGTQMFGAAQSTDFIERVTWHLVIALFFLCVITTIMPTFSGSVLEGLGQ
jgi:preprotein translocase subunit SecG